MSNVFRSIFTSQVQDTIPIPHDPEHSVTIRKLAPRHLEAAKKESLRRSLLEVKELRDLGGTEFMKEVAAVTPEQIAKETKRDPLMLYDPIVLMEKGVTAWTYDVERTAEAFEDLDHDAQDLIARAILKLSRPDLFVTPAEEEAERKNG